MKRRLGETVRRSSCLIYQTLPDESRSFIRGVDESRSFIRGVDESRSFIRGVDESGDLYVIL